MLIIRTPVAATMQTSNTLRADSAPLDRLTIMAIGVVTFIVGNVLHEAVGHGGACLLVGGVPEQLSSAHFNCHLDIANGWQEKWVASAGTLVNFIAAFVFAVLYYRSNLQQQSVRYFYWLAMSANYFVAAGYPLFSGVIGVGDWVDVVQGWEPAWLWRVLLIASGAILYFAIGIPFVLKSMTSLLGADPKERISRAATLSVIPYLAGATAMSIGALFNPIGSFVIFTSAAAAFGGHSAFAWMTQLLKGDRYSVAGSSVIIERNWTWIVAAVIVLLVHVFVLGPSIRFG
jgi:hypothetical protein